MRQIAVTSMVAFLFLAPTAAFAHPQPHNWKTGDLTGTGGTACPGLSNAPYVESIQAIVWANKDLGTLGEIDGQFGTITRNAVQDYQSSHQLETDGCVGYNTWLKAQMGYHSCRECSGAIKHMSLLKTTGTTLKTDHWRYRDNNKPRFVKYIWSAVPCWHLMRAVNMLNDNKKIIKHDIDHDYSSGCTGAGEN